MKGPWHTLGQRLRRLRVTHGFTVHSPFAYRFIMWVIREKGRYYCYDGGLLADRRERLLFRVANYLQPRRVCLTGSDTERARIAISLGCRRAEFVADPEGADLVYAGAGTERLPGRCNALYCTGIPHKIWAEYLNGMEYGMSFSNLKTGIAVSRRGLPRQDFLLYF